MTDSLKGNFVSLLKTFLFYHIFLKWGSHFIYVFIRIFIGSALHQTSEAIQSIVLLKQSLTAISETK